MTPEEKRLRRAQEIADQVKNGTYLAPKMSKFDTHFPERPKIKKDKNALDVVFGEDKK